MKMKNQKKLYVTYFVMIFALILTTISTAQAATFTVNKDTDQKDQNPGDGICAAAYRTCTLRAAVEEANALPGDDFINFSNSFKVPNAPKTIVLSLGQLEINSNLTINGPGARQLMIDGNQTSRVFLIAPPAQVVGIQYLTVQNGYAYLPDFLTCAAGICNYGESLLLTRVTVRNNVTAGGSPQSGEAGGGIANYGFLNLESSTVSGNAGGYGGGIYNKGVLYIYNSTISDNASENNGGGILQLGEAAIRNSTIANNLAQGSGGGIWNNDVLHLGNTIVANNFALSDNDMTGSINSGGNNLVRTRGSSTGYAASDLPDGTNPLLGALKNNGGPTDTRAIVSGSPAIDAGNDCLVAVPNCSGDFYYDQRGVGFPRKLGSSVDIGAFEFSARVSFVQISGKVLKPNGRGLNNAVVILTVADGEPRPVETDQHGNFSFDNVRTGERYIIKVESRQHDYASQDLFVSEERGDLRFVPIGNAEPPDRY